MVLLHLGYEGRTAEEIVALLAAADVTTLVDVRQRPQSRKPGLSRTRLSAALHESGIGYRHERTLGNPRVNRPPFHDGRVREGLEAYAAHLEQQGGAALARLLDEARRSRVAVLCVELEAVRCHRQELVARAAAAGIATIAR